MSPRARPARQLSGSPSANSSLPDAPARLVFAAWTTPALLKRWWAPKSMGMSLVSCDVDAHTGGTYRFEFNQESSKGSSTEGMAFFGTYLEVTPYARLVWTNEESADGAITTVTFQEKDGQTLQVFRELYPSKDALDDAFIGMEGGIPEQFGQLDELLVSLGNGGG